MTQRARTAATALLLVGLALPSLGCRRPPPSPQPPQLPEDDGAPQAPPVKPIDVELGEQHGCVLFSNGTVRCWGDNRYGQLGLGHTQPLPEEAFANARDVGLAGPAVEISARGDHTCARLEDGTVQCWGDNRAGQLGLPWPKQVDYPYELPLYRSRVEPRQPTPVQLRGYAWPGWSSPIEALGDDEEPRVVAPIRLPEPAVQLATGYYHTCARTESGRVFCWGWLEGLEPLAFHEVALPRPAEEVVSGFHFSCVRFADGGVRCWGENGEGRKEWCYTHECWKQHSALNRTDPVNWPVLFGFGRLGYLARDRVEHTDVLGHEDVGFDFGEWTRPGSFPRDLIRLSAGRHHTCGIRSTANIACWGDSLFQLLANLFPPPAPQVGWAELKQLPVQDIEEIALGELDICVRSKVGEVACWGSAYCTSDPGWLLGKLQPDCSPTREQTPFVDLPGPAKRLSVGSRQACALLGDHVVCWGRETPPKRLE